MNASNTAELKTELTSALDYMMAADARNSNKNIKVREWFSKVFHAHGRASRVSETKQAYNRVPEQFKHRDQHVIFVVDDDGTGSVIEAQVKAKQYSGLDSCLVLKKTAGGYSASVLMMASDSPVNLFFKAAYPGVRVEPLGQAVATRRITSVAGTLHEIHEHFCDDSREHGLHINMDLGLRFACALLSKRLVILTGLAGSGKTKLAQAFARWLSAPLPNPAAAAWPSPPPIALPAPAPAIHPGITPTPAVGTPAPAAPRSPPAMPPRAVPAAGAMPASKRRISALPLALLRARRSALLACGTPSFAYPALASEYLLIAPDCTIMQSTARLTSPRASVGGSPAQSLARRCAPPVASVPSVVGRGKGE